MSALSLAVSEGHLYTVNILLDRGADVNRRTKVLNLVKTIYNSPLRCSCIFRHKRFYFRLLLINL
jgi:hypothetical protein